VTLTPSKLPVGYVSNPNPRYDALIYGENGFLKVSGGESKPAGVPAGEYKLHSYRIECDPKKVLVAKGEKPAAQEDEEKKDKPEKRSLAGRLGSLLFGGDASRGLRPGPRVTFVSADATRAYPPVKVREGKTALLPFGPPYRPVVGVRYFDGDEAHLNLKLVGSAGEVCSDLMVEGDRPPEPTFEIRSKSGKTVASGKFEYG